MQILFPVLSEGHWSGLCSCEEDCSAACWSCGNDAVLFEREEGEKGSQSDTCITLSLLCALAEM